MKMQKTYKSDFKVTMHFILHSKNNAILSKGEVCSKTKIEKALCAQYSAQLHLWGFNDSKTLSIHPIDFHKPKVEKISHRIFKGW